MRAAIFNNGTLQFFFAILLLFVTFEIFAQTTEDVWIEQKVKTKTHHFYLRFSSDDQENGHAHVPMTLRVVANKTSKTIQEIEIIEAEQSGGLDKELLKIVDVNFDGYLDISMYAISGGAGPNSTEYFYIYNPKTRKFKFSKKLSSLTSVLIDSKNKKITSFFRASCCDHSSETYRYISGKLH